MLEFGPENFVRNSPANTVANEKMRQDAENELEAGIIDADKFLARVSYTSEALVTRLRQRFADNPNVLANA